MPRCGGVRRRERQGSSTPRGTSSDKDHTNVSTASMANIPPGQWECGSARRTAAQRPKSQVRIGDEDNPDWPTERNRYVGGELAFSTQWEYKESQGRNI